MVRDITGILCAGTESKVSITGLTIRTPIDIGRKNLSRFTACGAVTCCYDRGPCKRYDVVFCFNVLGSTLSPSFRTTLKASSKRYLLIRTALGEDECIRYEEDGYLENGTTI